MDKEAKEEFDGLKKLIDEHLEKYMPVKYPEKIYEAMRYSLLAPGKRLRPVLTMETARIFNVSPEEILPSACAVEMLHCQSLIHDDLPCMDNDDYRRGRLSNHKVFGEDIATLAGDALLSYAPQIIIEKTPKSVNNSIIIKILNEFFKAAGVDGIISGQVVDMESENKEITKETLHYLHEYKTARLFECAIRIGAIAGSASEEKLKALTQYALLYGHAFQIYDDLLDVTADINTIGKTPGKDLEAGKSTYISLFGEDEAKKQIVFLCKQACDILKTNHIDSKILRGVLSDISEGIS